METAAAPVESARTSPRGDPKAQPGGQVETLQGSRAGRTLRDQNLRRVKESRHCHTGYPGQSSPLPQSDRLEKGRAGSQLEWCRALSVASVFADTPKE